MAYSLYQITTAFTEDKNGTPLTKEFVDDELKQIRISLAKLCGGYTEWDARGGWVNNDGRLVEEDAKVFQLMFNSDSVCVAELINEAKFVANLLHQHSVLVVYNGVPSFVESDM